MEYGTAMSDARANLKCQHVFIVIKSCPIIEVSCRKSTNQSISIKQFSVDKFRHRYEAMFTHLKVQAKLIFGRFSDSLFCLF